MNANVKAATLTTELFQLLGKFKELSAQVHAIGYEPDGDGSYQPSESTAEFGSAVANLAAAYEQIKSCDLVIDAARDPKDQEYAFSA
jgi:hypothetical protein